MYLIYQHVCTFGLSQETWAVFSLKELKCLVVTLDENRNNKKHYRDISFGC